MLILELLEVTFENDTKFVFASNFVGRGNRKAKPSRKDLIGWGMSAVSYGRWPL